MERGLQALNRQQKVAVWSERISAPGFCVLCSTLVKLFEYNSMSPYRHTGIFLMGINITIFAKGNDFYRMSSKYLGDWRSVSFDDRRRVVDLMITTIAATSDKLNITWKI